LAPLIPHLRGIRSFDGALVRHLEAYVVRCVYSGDMRSGHDALAVCPLTVARQLTAAGRALYQKSGRSWWRGKNTFSAISKPGERLARARVMEKVQRRTEQLIQRG
jgi:hypothetical protein